MKTRNILVTGATSFVGRNLIKELIKDNRNSVFALVRSDSPNFHKLDFCKNSINIISLDMSSTNKLSDYLDCVDIVYLAAWRGARGKDRDNKKLQYLNVVDYKNTIDQVILLGAKEIIGIGSQAEYGITYEMTTEETECKPNTEYGKAKLEVCHYLETKCLSKKISYKWVRLFSVYGEGDLDTTLISYCFTNMKKGLPLQFSNCNQLWNFTSINDVSRILCLLLENNVDDGIYNLASYDNRILRSFIYEMKSVLHSKSELSFIKNDSNRQMVLYPSIKKIISQIGDYNFEVFSDNIKNMI